MAASLSHIALVSETPRVDPSDLFRTSAAIQKQVTRDLAQHWEVAATVDAFTGLEDVPPGYWPVVIVEEDPNLPESPIGGFHLDRKNQPFAVIKFTDHWQLIASHEILEMLVDPSGNWTIAGDSPLQAQGRVEFLVEVCDPSEAADFSYTVNGIPVSDFYTPHYFDPIGVSGVQYSFRGKITGPRQVLRGGYLSWHDLVSNEWWQKLFFGNEPEFKNLGQLSEAGVSLRSQIDRRIGGESLKAMLRRKRKLLEAARSYHKMIVLPSASQAQAWRAQIEQLKVEASTTPDAGPKKPQRKKARSRRGTRKRSD
jgi:hypothetical protein